MNSGSTSDVHGGELICDGRVVATLEVASSFKTRLRGLLGRRNLDGAILIRDTTSVHTIGMRFTIDVAYLDRDFTVLEVITMKPHRVGRPHRAFHVLEASEGSFARWGLHVGSHLSFHR